MNITESTLTCMACPTQIEGKVEDGRIFYFRARHGGWSLILGRYASIDNLIQMDINCHENIQRWSGGYEDGMAELEAMSIIMSCFKWA